MHLIKSFSSAATSCGSCPFTANMNWEPSGEISSVGRSIMLECISYYELSRKSRSQIAVPGTNELPVLKRYSSRSQSKGGTHTFLSIPSTSMHISPTTEFISSLVSPRNVNPRNLRQEPRGNDGNNQIKRRILMETTCLCRHQPQ